MALSNTAIPKEYGKFRESVLRGEIPVNEWVSMQMNRIDFLIESPDYYYDDKAIEGFIKFCETEMTLADGDPITLLPSFRLWAEDYLAWYYFIEVKKYNHELRRFEMVKVKKRLCKKQYLIVARGAAKSMYAAMVHAYALVIDGSTTHQIVTAPTMMQAEETMNPIRTAISRSRGPIFKFLTEGSILSNTWTKVKLASTKKGIEFFPTNSKIEVRTMSIDKLQGLGSKINSVDEWLSGKVKEDVIGALEQGAGKGDKDYFILATSSEGTTRNGVGDSIKMELKDILRGDYFAPHVSIWYYKLDHEREIGMPEMWPKANPNIGATVSYEEYEKDVERMTKVPTAANDIKAKRFGLEVEGASYFFTYEDTLPTHKNLNFYGLPCSMGMDASQGDDFWAFTFVFPLKPYMDEDGYIVRPYGIKTRAYVSRIKVDRLTPAMKEKYKEFINEGSLIVMDSITLEMKDIYPDIDKFIMDNQYTVVSFGFDPYNAKDFVERWATENSDYGVEKVIQGYRTESVPLGEIRNMAEKRLLHFDQEIMKFAMGNAIALQDDNGNFKLSKRRGSEKIDNVAALMDAWVAYKRHQEAFE